MSSSCRADTNQVLILPPTIPLGMVWGLLRPQVTEGDVFGNETPTYNPITVAIYVSTLVRRLTFLPAQIITNSQSARLSVYCLDIQSFER